MKTLYNEKDATVVWGPTVSTNQVRAVQLAGKNNARCKINTETRRRVGGKFKRNLSRLVHIFFMN